MEKIRENYFVSGNVLYANELNGLISKINEIIDNLKSSESSSGGSSDGTTGGVTEEYVNQKVNAAINELRSLISDSESRLRLRIETISTSPDGHTSYIDDEQWQELFKQVLEGADGRRIINAALFEMGVCDANGNPYMSGTVLQGINDRLGNITNRVSTLELLPGRISLIANNFDADGNPKYKGANIIAAINETGDSTVGISADKITLDGEVLSDAITAKTITAANARVQLLYAESGVSIGNRRLEVQSDSQHLIGEIAITESGNSDRGNVYAALSNDVGLSLVCAENTGAIGSIIIGKNGSNNDFGISVSRAENSSANSQSGIGYTGVINGARFINGICVGAA